MKRSPELFEKIERYLNKEMPADKREQFQKEMQNDNTLKNEVELHRQMQLSLQEKDAIAFREKIKGLGSGTLSNNNSRWSFILKAAAILVILLASTYFLMLTTNQSGTALYEKYYTAFPVEDILRGEQTQEHKQQVLNSYSKKEYTTALSALENLVTSDPEDISLKMYLANTYLNTDNESMAIALLNKISSSSKYFEHAQWYLALAHLKTEEQQLATDVLQQIVSRGGIHKENAVEILNKLDNPDPDGP